MVQEPMGLIVVQKRSKRRPKPGDIFRVDLTTGQTVWGRILTLDARVESISGLALLYFFRPRPAAEGAPASLPVSELLFRPVLTNKLGFSHGYFTIVDNRPFTSDERLATHCYEWLDETFHDETGAVLQTATEPLLSSCVRSYLTIEDEIAKALGIPVEGDAEPVPVSHAPLPEARFWSIVDAARTRAKKQSAWASSLAKELKELTPEDIAAFDAAFAERMRRAHDYSLWGAAYLLDDGSSDDGFLGFRAWLIFQGRDVFEAALKDPETLARFAGHGDFDAEEVLGVAAKRFEAKSDDAFDPAPCDNAEPSGQPFDEDALAERYPTLARAVDGTST
jgi:hypothetical protein